jgi:hypothetical protein
VHDGVSSKTPQGLARGKVARVISTHTSVDGKTVAASKSTPHYEVESEKSASTPFIAATRCSV